MRDQGRGIGTECPESSSAPAGWRAQFIRFEIKRSPFVAANFELGDLMYD
jgi:hypothetical protein